MSTHKTACPNTLSDKKINASSRDIPRDLPAFAFGDVKEFIKKLKEVMANKKVLASEIMEKPHIMYDLMIEEIDKLAGPELTETSHNMDSNNSEAFLK
jgi:hypothetical protein